MTKPQLKLISVLEVRLPYEVKRYKTFRNAYDAVKWAIYYDILDHARKRRGYQNMYHPGYDYSKWADRLERRVLKVMKARYGKVLP